MALTIKNRAIYKYVMERSSDGFVSVVQFYNDNKDEIAEKFGITSYQTFNRHLRVARKHLSKKGTA